MQVEKRTLNWLPKESSWDAAQAQRERRKAMHDEFLERQTSLANAFQTTRDDFAYGAAELAANAASARVSKTA